MADSKRYPPTARRLERLRQLGDIPHSGALTAAAALAVATGLGAWLGPRLVSGLAAALAQDLQQAGTVGGGTEALAGLLAHRLTQALTVMLIIGGTAILVSSLAHLGQTGFHFRGQPGSRSGRLPWSDEPTTTGRRRGDRPVVEAVLGLAAAGLLLAGLLGQLTAASSWAEVGRGGAWLGLWGRWLAVLGGLGIVHLLGVRARHWRRAAMSHCELVEEARETQGVPLTRQRRETWWRRRAARG